MRIDSANGGKTAVQTYWLICLYFQIREFVNKYLKQDGVFLLRLIGQNTSNICVTGITCGMWEKWLEHKKSNSISDDNSEYSSPSDDTEKPLMAEEPTAPVAESNV